MCYFISPIYTQTIFSSVFDRIFETQTKEKLSNECPLPYLFGTAEISVSYLPSDVTCSDLFPCRWQDADHQESATVISMIRPDQSCRVWCSLCRCHTRQTVRRPDPVWRSSRRHAERLKVESDSNLLSSTFLKSFWTTPPITPELVYTVYACNGEVVGRRMRVWKQRRVGGKKFMFAKKPKYKAVFSTPLHTDWLYHLWTSPWK